MSLHVLSAGTGYTYYTQEVASGDELTRADRELGDYYTLHGLPPGQWLGAGCKALGVSGNVTKEQMANLFGEGLHPNRELIVQEKLADGYTQKNAEKAAMLGRKYYQYEQKNTELGAKVKDRVAVFRRMNGREPKASEKHSMQAKEGAILFRAMHGRPPVGKEELGRFITGQLRPQQTAVAGFDMTMTPVKSVSLLWVLGGDEGRKLVEQAQAQAVKDTVRFLEENAVKTRKGTNGIAQEDVSGGLSANVFRHYDSREGDPNLHDHLVISNKVQDSDGHWKTLDSKLLHAMNVPASEFYNSRIQALLEAQGVAFKPRTGADGKQAIMEVAGIPEELITEFSSRSEQMRPVLDRLIAEYAEKHGHAPDAAAKIKLAQAANLDTRAEKKHGKSLEDLVTESRERAAKIIGGKGVDALLKNSLREGSYRQAGAVDVESAAREVIGKVTERRSTWAANHVMAETRRWAKTYSMEHGHVSEEIIKTITTRALVTESVRLTPERLHDGFQGLTTADGTSVFEHDNSIRYSSPELIRAENYLLRAGQRDVIPVASADDFHTVMIDMEARLATGELTHRLSPGQVELAFDFATSSKLLSVGIGAAGTGKSTAMEVVRDVVTHAGGNVVALAPSAAAAKVLGDRLGIRAYTADSFVLGAGELKPGDLVILDEAGMTGTKLFTAVTERAEAAGARIAALGDDAQLGAVSAGGGFGLLAAELGAVELDTIHRFEDAAEAKASLELRRYRDGEQDPFAWYRDNGRIQAGDPQTIEALAFTQWQSAITQGSPAVIMASTNEQAKRLSEKAQAFRDVMGELDTHLPGKELRDGSTAWAGDTIVTRKNDWIQTRHGLDRVLNGDLWTVEKVNKDGSLTVRHQEHGKKTTLDADYIKANVHLGYSYTVHRAQGMTVKAGIPIASASTARNAVYVALTRGEVTNKLFVELEPGQTLDQTLSRISSNHGVEESAHTAMRAEYQRINGTEQLAGEYRHTDQLVNEIRFKTLAGIVLGENAALQFTTAESWGAVATHLAHAEEEGWDPRTLFSEAVNMREFETAEDNSAVLAWRIERIMDEARKQEAKPVARPHAGLGEDDLFSRLAVAERREESAREHRDEARAMHGPLPRDHWTNRRFGHLGEGAIEEHISNNRMLARTDSVILGKELSEKFGLNVAGVKDARTLAWETKELQKELKFRAGLTPATDVQEFIDRGTANRKVPGSGHRQRYDQAHAVAAELRAEQRLRTRTPGPAKAAVAAPDKLPAWIAPHRAMNDAMAPESWREQLAERRKTLLARFEETGHLVAAEQPEWAAGLGSVPADADRNERWRDVAAEVAAFRERYRIPDTETVPIPEAYRGHDIGAQLHSRVVSLARGSANVAAADSAAVDATAQEVIARGAQAHAPRSDAQKVSDKDREKNMQQPAKITDAQRAAERLAKARNVEKNQSKPGMSARDKQILEQARKAGLLKKRPPVDDAKTRKAADAAARSAARQSEKGPDERGRSR